MLRHPDAQIQALIIKIDTAEQAFRLDDMLSAIHELEEISRQRDDAACKAAVLYFLSCYRYQLCQKQEALRLVLDALALCQEHHLEQYEVYSHNLCGILYEDLSDYSSCLDHYLIAYDLAVRIDENDYAPYFLVNIGNLFMILDDFEDALAYLINGFEGIRQIPSPCSSDLRNLAIAALNVIEAYVGCGNCTLAIEWVRAQAPLLREQKRIGTAGCFLLLGRTRAAFSAGNTAEAERSLGTLLTNVVSPENFNDYYTINILLGAFAVAIDMGSRSMADKLLVALEHTRGTVGLNTFDYKLEACRIRYFDRFFAQDEAYQSAKAYFYPFYEASLSSFQQLTCTYANSLFMRTELNRVEAERQSVQKLNAELRRSIDLDPFTGLYNKPSTRTHIDDLLAQWTDGQLGAFMLLDIDNFKLVNDTYGHQIGDRVIEGLADLMKNTFRRSDIVGRLGGDEFGVFLTAAGEEAILSRVEDLLDRVRKFRVEEQPLCAVTLSIGIRILHAPENYDAIVLKADQALYTSKTVGRDRYTLAE